MISQEHILLPSNDDATSKLFSSSLNREKAHFQIGQKKKLKTVTNYTSSGCPSKFNPKSHSKKKLGHIPEP